MKFSQPAQAQSASAQTMKTPALSGSLGASRGTPTQDFLKRYSATGAFKPTITTASSPHVATVGKAPEPEFYRRWTWWVSLAVIALLGFGGALLADWLLGLVIGLDVFVIPGKWLAFIVAGILFGVTYVALCVESLSEGDDLIFDLALPMILWSAGGSLIGWGLAVGAAHLAARFLSISPALVGYLVFGAVILSVAGWCIKEESEVSSNLEDWGHWLMAPLLVLLSIGAACLIDWLIGRGLDALRFSVPEMPGKWLAFLLTGVACGVAFLSTGPRGSEVAGIAIGVYGLSKSFAIGWGLALGAAYLVDRYLNISFALVGYIVYGLAIVYGIAMTREQISDA